MIEWVIISGILALVGLLLIIFGYGTDNNIAGGIGVLLLIIFGIGLLYSFGCLTADFSTTEANVKVQEVGTRYTWLNQGKQNYIRVQNAYSEDFSASSESWETCVEDKDMNFLQAMKQNKTIISIRVEGYGFGSVWNCVTGDRVVDAKIV